MPGCCATLTKILMPEVAQENCSDVIAYLEMIHFTSTMLLGHMVRIMGGSLYGSTPRTLHPPAAHIARRLVLDTVEMMSVIMKRK